MTKQMIINPSSINVCDQLEKPRLKIQGNTTKSTPKKPIAKMVNNEMINIFSFINQKAPLPTMSY